MSKMMLKMFADMAGIKPEDIVKSFEHFQALAEHGINTLDDINNRLTNIENHLGIRRSTPNLTIIEGNENVRSGTE